MQLLNTSRSNQGLTDRVKERISTFKPVNPQKKIEFVGKSKGNCSFCLGANSS